MKGLCKMKLVRKNYFYIIEFLIGIFIFNFIFSICKTLKLINIGAKNESFIENIKISFSETFLILLNAQSNADLFLLADT